MEDKRMLLAIVLSTIVVIIGFSIQNILTPPREPLPAESPSDGVEAISPDRVEGAAIESAVAILPVGEDPTDPRERIYKNNLIRVVFSPVGGTILSFALLEHLDGEQPVDMIYRGESDERAFDLLFGDATSAPIATLFHHTPSDNPHVVEFRRQFHHRGEEDAPFTIRKRYIFYPGEYLFEIEIDIENSVNEYIPLDFDGVAYTLRFGPQIGPTFQRLDNRNEYRRYYKHVDGRRRTINLNRVGRETITEQIDWVAIVGKYFTAIGAPGSGNYTIGLSNEPIEGQPNTSYMLFSRPTIRSSLNTDTYRFYLGPKIQRMLANYNNSDDNALGVGDLNIDQALDRRVLLGWLETVLKWLLRLFYRVIPNYGIAIIILTIVVKALLWPLTHKSYQSTSKMQALGPKMQSLRERLKDSPQKLNQEMAALYKKEGVNPAGGCLPLLLQFPFFIAMFGLFNNHFDLRGAPFIGGWIDDLSAPESIWNFGPVTLPLLGWNDLRLLPVIFVGTQLLSSMLTQTPSANTGQAKMMAYMLPIVFFFILYNMPSGLLVYWIITNLLTAAQQFYNNRFGKQK